MYHFIAHIQHFFMLRDLNSVCVLKIELAKRPHENGASASKYVGEIIA